MKPWIESGHCRSLTHCNACRNSAPFRESLLRSGRVGETDFDCPRGYPIGQPVNRLGDIVEKIAKPIARAIDRVAGTRLAKCGGCRKRKDALNRIC